MFIPALISPTYHATDDWAEEERFYDDLDATAGWDCNPDAQVVVEDYDEGLDYEDDEGDWQVLALDRFGDRSVNANF